MAAKPLQPLVLDSIGVYGLNRQSSAASLPPQWLTTANNIMLDEKGRVSTRKGIKQITNNVWTGNLTNGKPTTNTLTVKSLGEYRSATGATTLFAGAGANVYKINISNTPYTLDVQSFAGGTTKTDGNWQFTNFNNQFYGTQAGNKPINYSGSAWLDLEDVASYAAPAGVTTFTPSCLLGEYGRLWVGNIGENRDVVYYSDLLIGHKFQGGSSGAIDLKGVWAGDEIVSINSFMGKLVIFGKHNIVVYDGPWDVALTSNSTFRLNEVIEGVGCVARDSIQLIGDDIVFLSASGVRSLSRTMVQDKMTLTDLSLAVKDEVRTNIVTGNMASVKAQYDLSTGSYLLGFPDKNIVYVFDFKSQTPDGVPRITTWNFESKKNPRSFLSTDTNLYLGLGALDYEGRVAIYDDYYDVEKLDVTAAYANQTVCTAAGHIWESGTSKCFQDIDNTYQSDFKTTWLDFEQPGISKFLKRFLGIWSGGKNMNVTLNWFRDYNINPTSANFTLDPTTGGVNSLWGIGKYASAKYAPAFQPTEYKVSMSKAAKVVRLQVIQTVKGFKASLQNITIWAKQGKIR